MTKLKLNSKRISAIAIGVIMLGSTFAFALLSAFSPGGQEQFSIPQERILNNKLTLEQSQVLLENGYTLVEYSYTQSCYECLEIKNLLEDATNNAEKQMFLQEIVSTNETAPPSAIILNAFTGTAKTLENPTVENITEEVCNALTNPTVWCLRGI